MNSLECLEDDNMMAFKFANEIRKTILERWTQIRGLIREAFMNGINASTQTAFESMYMGIGDFI